MKDRDCKNCIYANYKDEYDNGCTKWECEYISKQEAIKLLDQIVLCKDCKHYGTHKWSGGEFKACTKILGAEPPKKPDDFCSNGERR